jgi:hypothetical protein
VIDTKIPCVRDDVAWVPELEVNRTEESPGSGPTCVHADQRVDEMKAAPTWPCGDPSELAKRYWPSQPPPDLGPQSMAADVNVSTT